MTHHSITSGPQIEKSVIAINLGLDGINNTSSTPGRNHFLLNCSSPRVVIDGGLKAKIVLRKGKNRSTKTSIATTLNWNKDAVQEALLSISRWKKLNFQRQPISTHIANQVIETKGDKCFVFGESENWKDEACCFLSSFSYSDTHNDNICLCDKCRGQVFSTMVTRQVESTAYPSSWLSRAKTRALLSFRSFRKAKQR